MKKSSYQKPALTVVSFKAERGFAGSQTQGSEQTSVLSMLFSSNDDATQATDDRGVMGSGWSSGW